MKKIVVTCLALVLAVVASITGTLAWLTAKTEGVTNTFTTAGIDLTLTETLNYDSDNDGKNDKWQAQMIPGFSYDKDPKVEVSADSVDCYLFVKFEETNNPSTYLTYTSTLTTANGWKKGTGTGEGGNGVPTGVWYRKVMTTDTTRSWELLEGEHEIAECKKDSTCICKFAHGYVTVKDLTKSTMPDKDKTPSLTYTAYATQLYKDSGVEFEPAVAWTNATATAAS